MSRSDIFILEYMFYFQFFYAIILFRMYKHPGGDGSGKETE